MYYFCGNVGSFVEMPEFRFRKFSLTQDRTALRLGTDAVLLGAAMTLPPVVRRALDIGTGCGVIALMAAQRLSAAGALPSGGPGFGPGGPSGVLSGGLSGVSSGGPSGALPGGPGAGAGGISITGIDIDAPSLEDARANFAASPWAPCLRAVNAPLQEYVPDGPIDLIFSNPPFFEDSLRNPDPRRSAARHSDTLSFRDIMAFASAHLADEGVLSLILPASVERDAVRVGSSFGLRTFRLLRIRSTSSKPFSRVIMDLRRTGEGRMEEKSMLMGGSGGMKEELMLIDGGGGMKEELTQVDRGGRIEAELTLMERGGRSEEYSALTRDFYL